MRVALRRVVAGLSALLAACAEPNDPASSTDAASCEPTALIAFTALEPLAPSDDPFGDRPNGAACPAGAAHVEDFGGEPAYTVPTGDCAYISARAPLLAALRSGDVVSVRIWHFALIAEASTAHVAVRIGEQTALDETVPIPSSSGLVTTEWSVGEAVGEGTPVVFHLHNHGANAWSLLEVARVACAP